MFTADNWTDYEILDASGGEKLERWGEYLLVRPDPQVIWNTGRRNPGWRKADAVYHRSRSGGGEWEFRSLPKQWSVGYRLGESDLTFHLKPFAFKHTGLFPEQAVNWEWFSRIIRGAAADGRTKQAGDPVRVLNLFAYTGGATIAAAASGAAVTHVDASKGMMLWAKENAASSALSDAPVRWLTDDCRKFVEREIRRGNHYDGIIMDPPSYGRGPKGELWKIEDSLHELVKLTASLLSDRPLFFLINSYTTGLAPAVLTYLIGTEIASRFGGHTDSQEVGLKVTDSGLYLPCGAAGRWWKEKDS